jgi:hypothetical protein
MGGWILHFYSKSLRIYGLSLCLLATVACTPARKEAQPRTPKPRAVVNMPVKLEGRELSSQELINYFFTSTNNPSACQVLRAMPRASASQERFRILESARVFPGSNIDSSGNIKKKDCTFICLNPRHWGSVRCRLCQEESLDLVDVWGRVGVGSHPIYEIAMQGVELPSRDEFMKLVAKERSKYGLVMWPFFETYRSLIKLGVKDAIEMRNQIVQERINEAFPGSFDYSGKTSKMEDSLSLAIITNALPNYSSMLILPYDSAKERARKAGLLQQIESVLAKPLPYFKSSSWSDFSDDAVTAINASVRSLQGSNTVEHSCAMALLHRNFAQMIRIIGYARLPLATNPKTGTTSFQASFAQMLDSPSGTKLRTCPAPGSFTVNGTRLMLNDEQISKYGASKETFEISGRIETLRRCHINEAKVYDVKGTRRILGPKASARATVEDNLALMRVLSHQLTAFNPGSNWWAKSAIGFPLGEFSDFDLIQRSGSVLPYQYHALALGLLQITLDALVSNHLVQVDSDFKETKKDDEVIGIRVSSKSRRPGSKENVETSIETALLMAEVVFKAGAYLKQLPVWQYKQAAYYNKEMKRFSSKFERYNYQTANLNFVNGLFGARDNLLMLINHKPLPNGAKVQDQVDQLKVATALLLATFATKAEGSSEENPRYTCAAKVVTHVAKGGEVKTGRCTPTQEKEWKKTFSWLSKIYQSPLFAKYSK